MRAVCYAHYTWIIKLNRREAGKLAVIIALALRRVTISSNAAPLKVDTDISVANASTKKCGIGWADGIRKRPVRRRNASIDYRTEFFGLRNCRKAKTHQPS